MSESINVEISFFLASVFSGMVVLFVYDIIRIVRRIIRHGKMSVSIEDIIFWIITSVFIFYMMYKKNNGVIRAFSIIAIALGMILYNKAISRIFIEISVRLLMPIKSGILFIIKNIKILEKNIQKRLKNLSKTIKMKATNKVVQNRKIKQNKKQNKKHENIKNKEYDKNKK